MKIIRKTAAVLALCGGLASSQAAPLNYDESVSGDLAQLGNVPALWVDGGINSVRGHMHAYSISDAAGQPQFDIDFDSVELLVPEGFRVTGMAVTISDLDAINVVHLTWGWHVLAGLPWQQAETCFAMVAPSPFCANVAPAGGALNLNLPVDAASLVVTQGSAWLWQDQTEWHGAGFNYTLTIDVARIPEPGTAALALPMLGMLAAVSRRRRRG
jgi:uncharacterized protein (TIGR03382 family)